MGLKPRDNKSFYFLASYSLSHSSWGEHDDMLNAIVHSIAGTSTSAFGTGNDRRDLIWVIRGKERTEMCAKTIRNLNITGLKVKYERI